MAYQDAWIRGEIHTRGDRACAERYDLIRAVVSGYRRQVTVWDLGANVGYFGCRLADEFGAVAIMAESRPDLATVCAANGLPTTVALTHRLSVTDLQELAASECPDVVLALNVLHHFEDWPGALEAVLALGETVIIETPGRGDVNSANYAASQRLLDAIEASHPELIGDAPSHVTPGVRRPIYRVSRPKTAVTAGYCYRGRVRARGPHPVRAHHIQATAETKRIAYQSGETRDWYPGINLWNWAQLGGAYPSRPSVCQSVIAAAEALTEPHGDLRPWNLILQGQAVRVIDGGHRQSADDAHALSEALRWILQPTRAYARAA